MHKRKAFILAAICSTLMMAVSPAWSAPPSPPPDEQAFIDGMRPIMAQLAHPYSKQLRAQRAAMVCRTIHHQTVNGWTGIVFSRSKTVTGGIFLRIYVMPFVGFGTAPNALRNMSEHTDIMPNSPLYPVASNLHPNQVVRFSGQLFPSPIDCLRLSLLTLGIMRNPIYLIRFTSLAPVT